MRKKKCYIYTRVSTMAQTEGYSLEAQVERLREYAEYRDLQIVGEYCEIKLAYLIQKAGTEYCRKGRNKGLPAH